MSARELVVLGTASQAPTRERSHNACFLRWDGEGILFDPGEGAQRQMLLAGIASSAVTRICITHFHGDHCLGLPGVIQRLSLDRVTRPVDLYFPAQGAEFVERLRLASLFDDVTDLRLHPVHADGVVDDVAGSTLSAAQLDHGPPTFGWRLEEPGGRRMVPELLERAGVRGPAVGRLRRDGVVRTERGDVAVGDVSVPRRGQRFSFVMDTRECEAAEALADGADLVVLESTFTAAESGLAAEYGHLTAGRAAAIAARAGARRAVLTHFSQRYPDAEVFAAEAAPLHGDVVVARDLTRVDVPPRSP